MVIQAKTMNESPVNTSVVGEFAFKPVVGSRLSFSGFKTSHPTFGNQIRITSGPFAEIDHRSPQTKAESLLRFISEAVPSGMTAIRLSEFYNQHGADAFLANLDTMDGLEHMGLRSFQASSLLTILQKVLAESALQGDEFSAIPVFARKELIRKFGNSLDHVISTHPYSMCEIPGVTANIIDDILRKKGAYNETCPGRAYGYLLTLLISTTSQGNTVIRRSDAETYIKKVGDLTFPDALVQNSSAVSTDGEFVGLTEIMEIESECSILLNFRTEPPDPDTKIGGLTRNQVDDALVAVKTGLSIELTDLQTEGVYNALFNRVSVITGLPGTGKTTSLRMLIQVLEFLGIRYTVVAPTGIAAKRVSLVTGAIAGTIHRIFGAQKISASDNTHDVADYFGIRESSDKNVLENGSIWQYSAENPYPSDLIVIDEASMVDVRLLYRILDATKPSTHLVFVGDPAQLPSVGPGNVLRDLIDCGRFPTVQLTEIFRQADTSDIIKASHDIYKGQYPMYPGSKQFRFVRASSESQVSDIVVSISEKLHELGKQYQVLAPCHGGKIGVTAFNERLREVFNPRTAGIEEKNIGGSIVRVRDRVLITKNDYRYNLFNGDIGKVMSFTKVQENGRDVPAVEIMVYNDPVVYLTIPLSVASRILRLAYAMTVHKFQGLEHEVIVIPVMPCYSVQLQRNLYYTAITRAIEQVIIVGDPDSFARAIANTSGMERHTRLQNMMELA